MGNYSEDIETLSRKKQEALIETGSASPVWEENRGIAVAPTEQIKKTGKKTAVYSSAYRQILEHDFTSQAWISKAPEKRKHRKHINSNYKAITGKKWTGLGSEEKNLRKKEFEMRRSLSLKASEKVAELLTGLNKGTSFEYNEDLEFLHKLPELDTGIFSYAGVPEGGSSEKADEAFIKNFGEHMPMLHRALTLYDSLMEAGSFPELEGEERTAIMRKLAYLKEVRTAYEDRIRIISSPYYVSLREQDFVGDAPESLNKIQKNKNKPAPLRNYAASVLRWRNRGLFILQKGTATDTEREKSLLKTDQANKKPPEAYASDNTINGITGKIRANYINAVLNDMNDRADKGMALKPVREWVYSDLKKKISKEDIRKRLDKMKDIAAGQISKTESEPEKCNKIRRTLSHLEKVSRAFDAGQISEDVMKVWLDRGLQHDLRMGKKIYEEIVLQKYSLRREEDRPYGEAIDRMLLEYFQGLPGGVVTVQNSKVSYIRKEDEGKVTPQKALNKSIQYYPERLGVRPDQSDFIHIIGGNANTGNVVTRAYISAKQQYKSKAVELFMKTLRELKVTDDVYFKIASKATTSGYYGMDDITVFFTANISPEMRKKILDEFYENCNAGGENILDGKDMCVTGVKYKDGIALAPEPTIAGIMNELFLDDSRFSDKTRLDREKQRDDKIGTNFSFNSFVTSMFCQSIIIANKTIGKGASAKINIADKETLNNVKTVFRQLCFLNGIDPGTMMEE